jgi:hypothetical protein
MTLVGEKKGATPASGDAGVALISGPAGSKVLHKRLRDR